jgi:hypothetical protein
MELLIMQFFSAFCYFLPLRSKYASQHPFLEKIKPKRLRYLGGSKENGNLEVN